MTSPLRRAREEVAVNIAVTGFVARTLGTQTQKYARQLESLEVSAKGNRQESRRMKDELSAVRLESGEGSDAWQELTEKIHENDDQHKIIQTDIQSTRLAQRRLQVATGESLAKIRGFGIVLGVTSLALGAASGAVIKLSGNIQELNTIAFQTNTSIQDLQFSARRFGVILGDPDMGKAAAVNLANIKHQIDLIATGMSNMDLGNLAMAGINYSELLGKNIEQIRAVFLRQLRASQGSDVASLRRREAIRQQVGGEVFTALTAELKAPDKKYNFNAVSEGDVERLGEFRKEYGAIRIGVGQFAEVLTLSLVPAIGSMFSVFSRVTRGITGFVLAHRTSAIVIGTVVVVGTALIGVLSGIFVIAYTLKLAVQGLMFAKVAWKGVTFALWAVHFRLNQVMKTGIATTIVYTVQTGKNAVITGVARTAHAGWAAVIGILTFAKTGLSGALVRGNALTTKSAVVTGVAKTAHAVWAGVIGFLSIALVKNSGLTLKNAVSAGISRVAHSGWAVVIGILTFAKTGLSVALVRNNTLTTKSAVVTAVSKTAHAAWAVVIGILNIALVKNSGITLKNAVSAGISRVAHSGWAVVIGILTFAKTGLSVALVRNNALTTKSAVVTAVSKTAHAAWAVVIGILNIALVKNSGITLKNAVSAGISRVAHSGWAVVIGILTFAKTGLSVALVRNNALTTKSAVVTAVSKTAHAAWAVVIGILTFAKTGLSGALIKSNALMAKSAVVTAVAKTAHAGWVVVIGILTFAKTGLSVALVRNNALTTKSAVVTAVSKTAHAAWAVVIGILTFAKTGLSGALIKSNALMAKSAVVTAVAKTAHAGWVVVIGILTFAKTGLSVALVRVNALMLISFVRTGAIAVVMGVVAVATGAWIVVTKAATVAQMALNVALWANPIGLIVAVIVLAIAALGGAAYAMFRWRREIWDFFGGWGKAVLLVLGPIGVLAAAIITVIQNWNKLKNLGPFSSGDGPSAPSGGKGWWDKASSAVVGGLKEGFDFGAKYSPSRLLSGGDSIATGGVISRQISPSSSNINNRTVNFREQMDINNTFNINGVANAKEVAAEIADRQREANSKNISFRDVGFALE